MSGRAVRKALRAREAEAELLKASAAHSDEDASSSEEEAPAPQKQSLFALLNIADERNSDDDDEQDDDEDDDEPAPPPPPKPAATSKKSKNKKKGKKGKAKAEDDGEDDIDRALRQLKTTNDAGTDAATATPVEKDDGDTPLSAVLAIDSRSLDAGNEMKKLFGRDALRPEDPAEGAPAGRRRGGGGGRLQMVPGATGGRALNKGRKNTFVQPKDEWPNAGSGGLGMEIEHTDANGVTTYRFVHSRQYQGVQREFMMCVASMGKPRPFPPKCGR